MQVVAHKIGEKFFHFIHKECLKSWAIINPSCPTCRKTIDRRSLFTSTERVSIQAKKISKVVASVGAVGAVLGIGVQAGRVIWNINGAAVSAIGATLKAIVETFDLSAPARLAVLGAAAIGVAIRSKRISRIEELTLKNTAIELTQLVIYSLTSIAMLEMLELESLEEGMGKMYGICMVLLVKTIVLKTVAEKIIGAPLR